MRDFELAYAATVKNKAVGEDFFGMKLLEDEIIR